VQALAPVVGGALLIGLLAAPTWAAASEHATRAASSNTVWLCRPGTAPDPCAFSAASTSVSGSGATATSPAPVPAATASKFDCFYVYPTVSTEQTLNADLTIQPAEVGAAVAQASRFSQVCNVWAPMYRQATKRALFSGLSVSPRVKSVAYGSLLSAWRDYLAHDNDGRPIVFIGHSQGAAMLIRLLRSQVDPSATLRKQLVSAIILGGNVQVRAGQDIGGSFQHIPTCQSATQTACVIAYSTFGSTPPPRSLFGRPGQGVSRQSGQTARVGQQVACVNPVTLSATAGALQPYFLNVTSKPKGIRISTLWVTYPGLYTAQCESATGATWLQVSATPAAGDPRPTVSDTMGPLWGYHVADVNLALGNLVFDVSLEESAYP
jgi:hypothetical protein